MEKNIEISQKNNKASVLIHSDVYPLEAIYDAAYNFLDKAYLLLGSKGKKKIEVQLKGKEKLNEKELEILAGEFLNELINTSLRLKISQDNKILREYIISTALIGSSKSLQEKIKKENKVVSDNEEKENDIAKNDPLGIAVPWEDKHKEEKE